MSASYEPTRLKKQEDIDISSDRPTVNLSENVCCCKLLPAARPAQCALKWDPIPLYRALRPCCLRVDHLAPC